MIKAGSDLLRATIIQVAHVLKRCDPQWVEMACTLKKAGKPGSVIAAAVANRWMRRVHSRMRGGAKVRPRYHLARSPGRMKRPDRTKRW